MVLVLRPTIRDIESGSNLKTHSVSVHGWSVLVHKRCTDTVYVHAHSVPEIRMAHVPAQTGCVA
jgi:hypothetical protein